jgi:hypothetical protein
MVAPRLLVFALACCAVGPLNALHAQTVLSGAMPQAVRPGHSVRLELTGQNLSAPLRIGSTVALDSQVVSVEPTKAIVDVHCPAGTMLGPVGLWLASPSGVSEPIQMLVDDLPSMADNNVNHARSQSQLLTVPCAVDGRTEVSQSDFYTVHLAAGAALHLELVAERMGSSMDGLVRVHAPDGRQIAQSDDSDIGPDSRLRIVAPVEGDYFIEVVDSRFTGDGRYRLRLGGFPLAAVPYPMAVRPGVTSLIHWLHENEGIATPGSVTTGASHELLVPAGTVLDRTSFGPASIGSAGGTWGEVLVRDFPLYHEPLDASPTAHAATITPLTIPCGISGRLAQTSEADAYPIAGAQGQTVRFVARTRSLGSPTLLRMQLLHPNGQPLIESPINEADEWSMDATLPEAGTYVLRVTDLLQRGGSTHAYWIEVIPAGSFAVTIKPDPNTRESRWLEVGAGATFIDFQVQRFGYDGPVELELATPLAGLRILNPVIPAKVNEQRIYLASDASWNPDTSVALQWIAKRTEEPISRVAVSSTGLRRSKIAHQPYPPQWMEGRQVLVGGVANPPFFGLEHPASILLPWPVKQASFTVQVKRLHEQFKEPITVLSAAGPEGWTMQPALDKDVLKFTLSRPEPTSSAPLPAAVSVATYGQTSHGRIESFTIPIHWFHPMPLEIEPSITAFAGSTVQIPARLNRSGPEVQSVSLQWGGLPAGFIPPPPLAVVAEQSQVLVPLAIPADYAGPSPIQVSLLATGKHGDIEFQSTSNSISIALLPLPSRVEAFPQSISLRRNKDIQRIVVTGWDAQNTPRDWSQFASWNSTNPAVAIWKDGQIVPTGNGQTELVATLGSHRLQVPVTVERFEQPARVEFENEVLVALSKQGCNSGACHGSPSGKGNFRLSLRAFDKQLDALTLVREESARRINSMEPDRSLLLLKPLMKVPHGGGVQIHKQDPAYQLLRDWIAQGATLDPAAQPRCVRVEVFPHGQRTMPRQFGDQQLVVNAHFADGTSRDVTSIAAYESSNTSVAHVSSTGKVTALARGESVILVRFLEHIETIPFLFVDEIPGFQWQSLPQHNFIDSLVDDKLKLLQYQPSPLCTDEVFLRRVYLDVLGVLPTLDEANAFFNNAAADKREQLIAQLLDRPEHAKFWALKWGDLLRMTGKSVGNEGVYKYYRWVEQSIRENMPYDAFAKQLLAASGSTYANPPANFYRTAGDMNDCVETISQVFLGARLQCAKCHNHPFERWTQDNYYGLGAFFQRVQRKKTQRSNELFVWSNTTGDVVQPRTGQTMKPWVPVDGELSLDPSEDRRKAFVDWLVRPDNPYLARVEANRIWSQLFARGIVDPIDDFRDSNPPTNRPLLDALTKSFVESGFDRKQLIRTILLSRTYQSSYETNPFNDKDTLYFSHQQPRLLGAEQLLDAINQLTQTEQNFGSLPPGTRATQIPAPDLAKVDFLKVFGQPERSTVCACERSEDSNLSMAIELFNGSTIYDKLRSPTNRFRKGIADGRAVEEIVSELYLAGLSRRPTAEELAEAIKHCGSKSDPLSGLEDLCWVLINTDEFLFQH